MTHTYAASLEATASSPYDVRAFGYTNNAVSIAMRTVNESALVATSLSAAPTTSTSQRDASTESGSATDGSHSE